MEKQTGN